MALISLKDIGFVGAYPLFSNLDLTVSKGDRIGLVAANGRGKSTLLRIIAGESDATRGEITTARGLRVGLAPQAAPEEILDLTVHEAVLAALDAEAAETESWRVDVALDDLDVPRDLRHLRIGALSGGWRRVALLARTWVREPDVLLMDEPTNDLDLRRIGHLQTWLSTVARGVPFVAASHDRAFLDAVTDRTLFLRPDASRLVAAPFTTGAKRARRDGRRRGPPPRQGDGEGRPAAPAGREAPQRRRQFRVGSAAEQDEAAEGPRREGWRTPRGPPMSNVRPAPSG